MTKALEGCKRFAVERFLRPTGRVTLWFYQELRVARLPGCFLSPSQGDTFETWNLKLEA